MAKLFRIVNQKSGVGKTTTTVNLAAGLTCNKQRVLLVDVDPQGNATMGGDINKSCLTHSIYEVLLGLSSITDICALSDTGQMMMLPANKALAGAEIEMVDFKEREYCLKKALACVSDSCDFILIDCPPALSLLTLNGLCAADGVIIPMQCEYYALEGITDLLHVIEKISVTINPQLTIIGVLRVMFDPRAILFQQVSQKLEHHFGKKVFKTIIPRNIRLAEAPSHGVPGVFFDKQSKGAQAYIAFSKEIIQHMA